MQPLRILQVGMRILLMQESYLQYHHSTEALMKLLLLLGIKSARAQVDDIDFEIKNALMPDPSCGCGCC